MGGLMTDLNLASRPARNEALPAIAFYVGLVALLALSVKHAFVVRSLMPDQTSTRKAEVTALEEEASRLRRESAALRGPLPDKAVLARWAAIKELVDKRTFSWTRLLARLETVIPQGVRIAAIAPRVEKGVVHLELTVEVQSSEAGLELLKRLQQRSAFRDATPISDTSKDEGSEYRYSMLYDPSAPDEARPAAPTTPADDADATEGEGEESP
jgi:Tfp pilus assembly protein PilN